jgi:hypothetical protein
MTIFYYSDLRLPFSSPLTTRRATLEVFDFASTRIWGALSNERAFYKMSENLVELTASKGSNTAVHFCVVPDTPVIPW